MSLYLRCRTTKMSCRATPTSTAPRLPHRAAKSFAICLYISDVGQPEWVVGQPRFDTGCPTGQPAFKTNVKPC